jgi:hypothetical protein
VGLLSDFSLRDGHLVIKRTGAAIPIDSDLVKEVYRAGSFITSVAAIRATRDAKNLLKSNLLKSNLLKSEQRRITIAFTPDTPRPWYAIWPVCKLAGLHFTKTLAAADILFHFEDSLTASQTYAPKVPLLNGACTDISKSRVACVFEQIFGYPLAIDPNQYQGEALEKSEGNGVHDGRIISCPVNNRKPDAVYQKLIHNSTDGKVFTDIRTPVVGDKIPTLYLKQRHRADRFSNENFRVVLTTPDEIYTPREQGKIIDFARTMRLDFGGLDILRHYADGRLYIVDVNKTDMGPPTALPSKDKHIAMQKLADAFRDFVESKLLK